MSVILTNAQTLFRKKCEIALCLVWRMQYNLYEEIVSSTTEREGVEERERETGGRKREKRETG